MDQKNDTTNFDKEKTFQNYQRILNNTSTNQIVVLGFFLTIQTAGTAAIYQIIKTQADWNYWSTTLCALMMFTTLILGIIWWKELDIAEQTLKCSSEKFPEVHSPKSSCPMMDGFQAFLIKFLIFISLIVWFLIFVIALITTLNS